jgi:hypothetical protein
MALKTCSNIGANSMPIPFIIGLKLTAIILYELKLFRQDLRRWSQNEITTISEVSYFIRKNRVGGQISKLSTVHK